MRLLTNQCLTWRIPCTTQVRFKSVLLPWRRQQRNHTLRRPWTRPSLQSLMQSTPPREVVEVVVEEEGGLEEETEVAEVVTIIKIKTPTRTKTKIIQTPQTNLSGQLQDMRMGPHRTVALTIIPLVDQLTIVPTHCHVGGLTSRPTPDPNPSRNDN